MIEAVENCSPVTALKFIKNDRLLAGSGFFVKSFDWKKSARAGPVSTLRVFTLNRVHGITTYEDDERGIAWGGDNLAVLDLTELSVVNRYTVKDRVLHCLVYAGRCYVLTAHNEVLEINLNSMALEKTHKCEERSILYSGSLFVVENEVQVAAGTVFGGVVVWSLASRAIVQHLKAHEGSIFDVGWSSDGSRVVSCSDDRAVIVSDLHSGKAVAYGWGHISRIWKVKFVSSDMILSISEDCSARLWRLNTSDKKLACERIMTGHQGRSIWAVDVCDEMVAATGGQDGKVMLWDLQRQEVIREKYGISQVFGTQVRSCAINASTTVVTCKDGKVFVHNHQWELRAANLGPVPLVKQAGTGFVVLSVDGSGLVLDAEGRVVREFRIEYKVLDFFVVSSHQIVVVPTPPSSKLVVVSIGESTTELDQRPGLGVITCVLGISDSQIVLGTRNGALALYNTNQPAPVVVNAACLDSRTDAITALILRGNTIIATARSSDYGIFSLSLQRMFKDRARKRGSIEGLHSDDSLVFWGFQKDTFLAWDQHEGHEMVAFDCGGAHRAWDVAMGTDLHYVFARNSELSVMHIPVRSTKFTKAILQYGTHGREIRGMEVHPRLPNVLATASEDTSVSISQFDSTGRLMPVCTVSDGHASGIQSMHWHPTKPLLFSGAGTGELVMWTLDESSLLLNETSRMPTKGIHAQIKELRIMDFAFHHDLVAVAYSDSSFRIWEVKEYTDGKYMWDVKFSGKYGERCLLNIDMFENNGVLWLAFSSTDGFVVLYTLDDSTANWRAALQIHQSNIRSSVFWQRGEKLVYFSGGDDNTVKAVQLEFSGTDVTFTELFAVANAHASAVTSLAFLPATQQLVSTGSDQKIRAWSLTGELESSTYTDVSDTNVLAINGKRIITAGIGLGFNVLR